MAEIIRMPRLSDTMEEGNIVSWLKKVGDKVSPGDILAEVETDKATMELESFHDGYLLYISVESGPVPVNDVLAVIGEKDEDYKSVLNANGKSEPEPASKESTQEEGNKREKEQTKQEKSGKSETKKEKPEQEKSDKEKPEKEKAREESSSAEAEAIADQATSEKQADQKGPSDAEGDSRRIKSSPLAKSMAAEAGIELSSLKGSGDGGRIIRRDVENYVSSGAPKASGSEQASYEDVPLSQMRKTIARRLAESKFSSPHYYLTMKINMDRIAEARKLINEKTETKISFNDFIIKGCAVALRQHPAINASWMGDKIRYNKNINIGVAVAVEEGLLVPVLFDTDKMGLGDISRQVTAMAEKARQKKLQPQEMQGNTFTVSNLGMFGIEEFTAIINPPDAAIMAIGAINDEVRVVDGHVTTESVMRITMSCDHRVIDGATGAKFLQTFKQLMENPIAMLV